MIRDGVRRRRSPHTYLEFSVVIPGSEGQLHCAGISLSRTHTEQRPGAWCQLPAVAQ